MHPFSANEFYAPGPPDSLLQGDIFLCPSAVLVSLAGLEAPLGIPDPPDAARDLGTTSYVQAWRAPAAGSLVPGATHATRWGPIMVLSHECELQKDFNALIRILLRQGVPQDEAIRTASTTPGLDRYALVTPVLTYDDLRAEWVEPLQSDARLDDVRRGARVSYFPLPPHPEGLLPDGVVSLARIGTIERRLLKPSRWIASLSDAARGVLRHKLERTFATRDASVLEELEAAVGQTITDVRITPLTQKKGDRKQVAMVVYLANGEILHLEGAPVKPGPGAGPSRVVGLALEE